MTQAQVSEEVFKAEIEVKKATIEQHNAQNALSLTVAALNTANALLQIARMNDESRRIKSDLEKLESQLPV